MNLSDKSLTKLQKLVNLAKDSDTGKEFYQSARLVKDVPQELADWFANNYGFDTMLTPEKASEHFIEDCKNGEYDD